MDSDWRLAGCHDYLQDRELRWKDYTPYRDDWEHDHCDFCTEKFSLNEGDLHRGYATLDNYHWICENCYNDFKELFRWKLVT